MPLYSGGIDHHHHAIPMSKKSTQPHTRANNALTLAQAHKQAQRHPTDPDAWLALGRLLAEQKDWENARDALEQAHGLRSENADQQACLGYIAYHQNRTQDAMHHLHDALARNPTLVLGLVTLAKFHIDRSEFQQGLEYAQQAYEASPQHIPSIDTLASALSGLFRYEEALELYRRLTELLPQDFSSWNNAGNMLRDIGHLNESYAYYKQANTVGRHPTPYSNHLTTLHYDPRVSREEIMAFAKSWEERFAPASHLVPPRPERPNAASTQTLRLGLLSDGFRKHPVGKMITRCLENLPKGQFELYCYTTSDAVDVVTQRIQHCAQNWQPIRHLNDNEFIKQIRDDEIDILIDLSGHNTGSRMRAIAMQPAPLIVKWVGGLINTTGVQAIDYLISDHVETPKGEDEYYTEKLIRMPDDYIVFNPPEKLPALSSPPAQQNGYITLACFNNPTKLNDVTLKQWAGIMHELPDSRLLLKGRPYTSESFCERLYTTLEAEGITRERLIIEGPGNNYEMLEAYNRADISLDPWPYSGGLTTCESFIMGVPVVTLPGPTFAGRHSATHLVHAGMPELVVNSWEEYRARVIELASDLESLGTIRQHLRDILLQSPVCDGPRFARHFTDAMRAIWQRYCDEKAPAALTFNKEGEARFEDEDTPVEIYYAEASEEDAEFQWQFDGKLIAVDNGGQLLESDVVRQLLQKEALELIAFDPSSQAPDTSLKQHKGVHYYPNATLGDGQPGQLHACLDPKLSASLAPLGDEHQPEAIRKGSQVLTRLSLNTIKLDSIDGLPAIDWLVLDDLNDATAILDNGTQALKDTLLLQVKVAFQPTHERQPNLAEIQHWASRNGFRFYRLHEPQHRSHLPEDVPETQRQATEMTSADALLLPSHGRMETLSDNQRTRLAFLLHTVFGIKDLTYSLLQTVGSADQYMLGETLPRLIGRPFKECLKNIKTKSDATSIRELITNLNSWNAGLLNELIKESEKALQADHANNTAYLVLTHALLSKGIYEELTERELHPTLEGRLKKFDWNHKRPLYNYWLSKISKITTKKEQAKTEISIILISNKFKPEIIENAKELKNQKHDAELIFVNNGAPEDDFQDLTPYIDTWINLQGNSGAYLARNIGALYSNAPIILFVDDDGFPEKGFIDEHLRLHKLYEIASLRGVYLQKTQNIPEPKHYYLGNEVGYAPPILEGNASFNKNQFMEIGGWGDYILFGHGGFEIATRLEKAGLPRERQLYTPNAVLRHDYIRGSSHASAKIKKQTASWLLLYSCGYTYTPTPGAFHLSPIKEASKEAKNGKQSYKESLPEPSFPKKEKELVEEHYLKNKTILEYGSGGSTLLAASMEGKKIYSVENDAAWAKKMENHYNKNEKILSPFIIHHVDIGKTSMWAKPINDEKWENFHRYPLEVWDREDFEDPDVILIDGRLRVACFLAAMLRIKKPTTILFDDYTNRDHYHCIEKIIKPEKHAGRMALFNIKPNAIPCEELTWVFEQFTKVSYADN